MTKKARPPALVALERGWQSMRAWAEKQAPKR